MRLFLSSYKFSNQPDRLFALLKSQKPKLAIVTNAADVFPEKGILERYEDDAQVFSEQGLKVERLDLRQYFGDTSGLRKKAGEFGSFWVRGGNTFVLRQAMKQSGFDEFIINMLRADSVVYAGYSAGCCVLSPTLEGFDIVDDPTATQQIYSLEADYSGLGILPYYFEPHFESDHPESSGVAQEIEKLKKLGLPYRTLRDGEAILIDGEKEELLQ